MALSLHLDRSLSCSLKANITVTLRLLRDRFCFVGTPSGMVVSLSVGWSVSPEWYRLKYQQIISGCCCCHLPIHVELCTKAKIFDCADSKPADCTSHSKSKLDAFHVLCVLCCQTVIPFMFSYHTLFLFIYLFILEVCCSATYNKQRVFTILFSCF